VPAPRLPHVALAGGLAAAGALAAGWRRLLRRPLPQTDGTLRVGGLDAPIEIARDRFGVPRVTARSPVDLCFGHGFCHGQDRLWQLELYRRYAAGRVSEFAGEEGLESDRLMRTLGLRRTAESEVDRIGQRARDYLTAYGLGVDAAVASVRALPVELQLLGLEPEPWTPVDSLSVGKIVALGFSTNMETELFRSELVRKIGVERAERLEPAYPSGNPLVLGGAWSGDPLALAEQLGRVREALGIGLQPAASNNWAVSGERSITGRPLLASDPHITTSIPDVWYQIELSAPGLELWGGSMPTFPGIVIGQTPRLAWGFTNAMADVQDLFVERIVDGHYEFEGSQRPLTVHREEIHIRGRGEPHRLEVRETHHGPLITGPLGAEGDDPLALAWTGLREPFYTSLGIDLGGMESGEEAVERFSEYSVPVMNMVWADGGGNIGYKLVGKVPLRRGGCPDLPKPGWTGEHEWVGYVPYGELPAVVNPTSGVLVTANNRVAPEEYPHHITSEYLDGYRAARIERLLAERERHSLDDFERIQSDVYSIPGETTAARLLMLEPKDPREQRALELLREWDHRLDPDSEAASVYKAFIVHFARLVSEAAIGDPDYAERWRSKSLLGFTAMTSSPWRFHAHLLDLWEEADPKLVGGRDWEELVRESLRAAMDELERAHRDLRWGSVHGLRFPHALGEGRGRVSSMLDRLLSRRLRAGGGQETVSQIGFVPHAGDYTGSWAPSYRLLADVGQPERSRWQHMTGQSGHPGSRHYDDLLEDWLAGRSNPSRQSPVARISLQPL
jgi:penicillin G amidase